jgi:RND family efflux transporter MFP subunit
VWLERARSGIEVARASVAEAKVELARAELALARTVVHAPADGVVLERLVAPGASLEAANASVVALYEPSSLRVRVDVPQGDVAKVSVGQRAEILAEARAGKPYAGEVVRVVHRADIQKVTLQVHVRVAEPDELLRPEMLCQVRFFGAAAPSGAAQASDHVLVPKRLVQAGSIWIVDGATGTAKRRAVEVVRELPGDDGDSVEIASGLDLSDKVIDPRGVELVEGARVTWREER